jgi:hypothetical protein
MKRIFGILLGAIILTLAVQCSNPASSDNKRPQVIVDQAIMEDTVWESGKDYVVKGEVAISENAVLRINRDVTVILDIDSNGEKGKLVVSGSILAVGDAEKQINFETMNNNKTGLGINLTKCRIAPLFYYCRFVGLPYGINMTDSNLKVSECLFDQCVHGLDINESDSVSVSNSIFDNNSTGLKVELSSVNLDTGIVIKSCSFLDCAQSGVDINQKCHAIVRDNLFEGCAVGLSVTWESNIRIEYNDFSNCIISIFYDKWSNGQVSKNNFSSVDDHISMNTYCQLDINQNNLYQAGKYKIRMGYSNANMQINASNNWWDTTYEDVILKSIYDSSDQVATENNGVVIYQPFETNIIAGCGSRTTN